MTIDCIWRPRGLSAVVALFRPAFTGRGRGFRWSPARVRSCRGSPSASCRSHPGPNVLRTVSGHSSFVNSLLRARQNLNSLRPTPYFLFLVSYFLFLVIYLCNRRTAVRLYDTIVHRQYRFLFQLIKKNLPVLTDHFAALLMTMLQKEKRGDGCGFAATITPLYRTNPVIGNRRPKEPMKQSVQNRKFLSPNGHQAGGLTELAPGE